MPTPPSPSKIYWQDFPLFGVNNQGMYRLSWALLLAILVSCSGNKPKDEDDEPTGYSAFTKRFREVALPYHLSDSALIKNRDTSGMRYDFSTMVDTMSRRVFGSAKVKYTPMARIKGPKGEIYYIIKALSGARRAAFLLAFDKSESFGAAFPFLVPDADPKTTQTSSIERNGSITRAMARKTDDQVAEGRDVYSYDPAAKVFSLVMTDLLDDRNSEVINPIDTLPRTHRFAGDYYMGKTSYVSVRDGRSANQLMVFLHNTKETALCGELKGTLLLTSSTTAVYRQGGDPCVLELRFSGNTVTVKEMEGCGARRELDCSFDGTFTKKKTARPNTPAGKP
jgi:hypothetical protein